MNFATWLTACETSVNLHTTALLRQGQAGSQRSRQSGSGFRFKQYTAYRPGDLRRFIDWKASRKADTLLLRQFEHEARLDVMAICDLSTSMHFGYNPPKLRLALDCTGILGLAASRQGHAFGLMTFAADVISHIPPRQHKGAIVHALAHLWELSRRYTASYGTQLKPILRVLASQKPQLICLMSDFRMPDWRPVLRTLRAVHDLIVVFVEDPAETRIANRGRIALRDLERGQFIYLDTASATVRHHYREQAESERASCLYDLRHICGSQSLVTTTSADYAGDLVRFLMTRTMHR